MVHAADSEEFWEKLEEMKAKYREPLKKMYSFMTIIANSQRPEKKEQFKKHLKDCFQILGLKRGAAVPSTLTTAVLETASKFIDSVINVYKNYIVNEQHARAAQAAHVGKNSTQSGANSQASRVSAQQYAMMQNSQSAAEGGPQAQQEMFRKLQQQQYQRQQEQAVAAGMGGSMGDNAAKAAAAKAARSMQQNITEMVLA